MEVHDESSPVLQSFLTLSTLGKIFSRQHFEIFFFSYFCMKCQILFSGKNKKNIINLSSAENAQRVVKVKKKCGTSTWSGKGAQK